MKLDVLAVGAHPDDVELGCGGTVALLARRGLAVGILHLTRGEAGTRGTIEERRAEAEKAASILGAGTVEFLDFGDGGLRTGTAEEDELITVIRRLRPEMILAPAPADRHPDHGRAYHLITDCCYYAGLAKRGSGKAYRPAALFSYMQHDPFEPNFVIDVGSTWELKMEALKVYRSQLYQDDSERDEPATKVASREFREAVVGRAQHYGLLIGAAYGEPFWSRVPLAVADPWMLLPRGLR
ncbi:MAG: bacillithiol biosynthesis deacetylase BshB1 [Acidobacteriota bacterium]